CAYDIRELQERVVDRSWFQLEHVQTSASELAGCQCYVKSWLVNYAAPRRIDEIGRGLHPPQSRRVEHSDRLRSLGTMDADEVGARQGGIQVCNGFAPGCPEVGGWHIGIIHQDVHFHRLAALGAARTNAAEADNEHSFGE